jgi:hypothetical protein
VTVQFFNAAVIEFKAIEKRTEEDLWRRAELAHKVQQDAAYGDSTLAKFAEKVGVVERTIRQYCQTYQRFGQNGSREPFSALRPLLALNRNAEELAAADRIAAQPNLTRSRAQQEANQVRVNRPRARPRRGPRPRQPQIDNNASDARDWSKVVSSYSSAVLKARREGKKIVRFELNDLRANRLEVFCDVLEECLRDLRQKLNPRSHLRVVT